MKYLKIIIETTVEEGEWEQDFSSILFSQTETAQGNQCFLLVNI